MMFIISEMLKDARRSKITQEQLAEKQELKNYISRIENGKGNIQLSILIKS
jgi:transcriptional regulator with XRE-family HTH domain